MEKIDYDNMDFYEKLRFLSYTCWEVQRGLKSIVNESMAKDYIDELMDQLIETVTLCSEDEEFKKEENFGKSFEYFSTEMRDALEIAPLIKARKADYSYLLKMLDSLINIIERTLPNNIRLARFFQRLLNSKTEIADHIGVSEDEFTNLVSKMLNEVDTINDILKVNDEKKKVK